MKAHIGVDAQSGLVHTLVTTAANTSDISQAHALLHGKTRYRGLAKNEAHLFSLFGFANLLLAQRRMPAMHARGAP